jgi:hypothetical protein
MWIPDINLLLYAHYAGVPEHVRTKAWLDSTLDSGETFMLPDLVVTGLVRLMTHRKILPIPASADEVIGFVTALRTTPGYLPTVTSSDHIDVFARICRASNARGDDIPDAYLAAHAIENNATLCTNDRGFARFPGLKWMNPLAG